jgi:hypothetical protein
MTHVVEQRSVDCIENAHTQSINEGAIQKSNENESEGESKMRRNLRMDPTRVAGCQSLACFDPMLVTYHTYRTHSEIRNERAGRGSGAKPVILRNCTVFAKIPQRKAGIFPFAADPACNHCIQSIPDKTNRNFRCVIFLLTIPNLCNCSPLFQLLFLFLVACSSDGRK